MKHTITIIASCFLLATGFAQVKPASLFSDNMVLQRETIVPVWGTASEGESITVEFEGQKLTATAKEGKWKVSLKPLKAGGPFTMTIKGNNTITIKNILVGEVWLCSGQSNMERAMIYDTAGKEAVTNSANDMLRLVTIPHNSKDTPQTEVACKWVASSPATTLRFSATAYWFGSKLQKELGVPVGIVNSSYGGTPIEAWINEKTLMDLGLPKDNNNDPTLARAEYERRKEKMKPIMDKYNADKEAAKQQHLPAPPAPAGIVGDYRGPNVLYNGMITPLIPYAIKGMVWYQGENNSYLGRANTYYQLLPALIKEWRGEWGQGNIPFFIVQLCPNRKKTTNPTLPSGIATVSDAQRSALSEPNTALLVTTDLVEPDGDVHYKRKEPLGARLVLAADALAYGKKIEYSGPLYKNVEFKGNKAILSFSHIGGGLVAKDTALTGFTIAGEDKKFYTGNASIEGDKVIVTNPNVANPKSVRYGWADHPWPDLNCWNKAGLPAAVFRTDNWELPVK